MMPMATSPISMAQSPLSLESLDFLEHGQLDGEVMAVRETRGKRLEIYRSFLDSVRPTLQKVNEIKNEVSRMQTALDATALELSKKLDLATAISMKLEAFKSEIDARRTTIQDSEALLVKYKLSFEEKQKLRQLDFASSSHSDLLAPIQRLLEIRKAPIMIEADAEVADLMENANEKLAEWFERNISSIQLDSVNPSLATLVSYIVEMRGFEWFAAKYAARRSTIIQRHFSTALTIGSPHAKPIEVHSSAPVRYVSDILAWIHEAFANELDLVDILLESVPRADRYALVGSILIPCSAEIKDRIEAVQYGVGSLSVAFNIHLILLYYREWFARIVKQAEPSIVSALSCLCQIYSDVQTAQIDKIYEDCLSERIDARTLLPSPGLSTILDQIALLQQVFESCLGPSDREEIFGNTQQLALELLLRVLALHQNSLEDIEVELLRLNCFSALDASCDLPDILLPIREHAYDAVSRWLLQHLFRKAQLPEDLPIDCPVPSDLALACVKNLHQTFVIHSGWDAAREEARLISASDRHCVSARAIDAAAQFYQKAYKQLSEEHKADPAIKSPETVRLMLSANACEH